jgi:hypothetical protein
MELTMGQLELLVFGIITVGPILIAALGAFWPRPKTNP